MLDAELLEEFVLAAAAVGTASMGVVELGKGSRWFATLGAWPVRQFVKENQTALQYTWGPSATPEEVALDAWRLGEGKLRETLETGILLAVDAEDEAVVRDLSARFGVRSADLLRVTRSRRPKRDPSAAADPVAEEEDRAIERANSAFDLRVRSAVERAVARACAQQRAWFQALAAVLSIVVSLSVGAAAEATPGQALLVGFLAVPLAPVAKNFVSLLQSARSAFSARSA